MEIKRDIYQRLIQWKEQSKGTTALLIEGARRIGKSTIANKFGKEFYRSYLVIDFAKASKRICSLFEEELDNLDRFYRDLFVQTGIRLYERESLIVFDEIQCFPKAREALKYLVQDGRYDFIETGSLISIKENVQNIVIPSEEEKIKMYPITFPEFLVAAGEEGLWELIQECYQAKKPLDNRFHPKAMRLFEEYILVGGMPKSVTAYFENQYSFLHSDLEKRKILSLYQDDIHKATVRFNSKVSALFEYLPSYLSKHDKKIILSEIGKGQRFSQYDEPLFWLEDSMICNLCYKCNDPNVGFSLNLENSSVKCYMGDTGLLFSHTFSEKEIDHDLLYRNIMDGKLSLNQGMFYENAIAQMIVSSNRKLYYYSRFDSASHRNDMEIDFMISNESKTRMKVYPIEVKSSKNYTAQSITKFKEKFGKKIATGYIVHPKPYSEADGIIRIPVYMLPCLLKDSMLD